MAAKKPATEDKGKVPFFISGIGELDFDGDSKSEDFEESLFGAGWDGDNSEPIFVYKVQLVGKYKIKSIFEEVK